MDISPSKNIRSDLMFVAGVHKFPINVLAETTSKVLGVRRENCTNFHTDETPVPQRCVNITVI